MLVCVYVCMCECVCACMRVCVRACMCMCACMYLEQSLSDFALYKYFHYFYSLKIYPFCRIIRGNNQIRFFQCTIGQQTSFLRVPLLKIQHGHCCLAKCCTGELSGGKQLLGMLRNEIGVNIAGLELWVRGKVDEELKVGAEPNNLWETIK